MISNVALKLSAQCSSCAKFDSKFSSFLSSEIFSIISISQSASKSHNVSKSQCIKLSTIVEIVCYQITVDVENVVTIVVLYFIYCGQHSFSPIHSQQHYLLLIFTMTISVSPERLHSHPIFVFHFHNPLEDFIQTLTNSKQFISQNYFHHSLWLSLH